MTLTIVPKILIPQLYICRVSANDCGIEGGFESVPILSPEIEYV
jgi:hypothetical protein